MSGLLFMTHSDFQITKTNQGNLLTHNIPNLSLILIYSTQCEHCSKLLPIFKKLPSTIDGCQFGILNIGANKNMIPLCKDTILPIEYVPLMVLFIDKKPFMKYNGPHDIEDIRKFVIDVSRKMSEKQKFVNTQQQSTDRKISIDKKSSPCTTGVPLYGQGGEKYITFVQMLKSK